MFRLGLSELLLFLIPCERLCRLRFRCAFGGDPPDLPAPSFITLPELQLLTVEMHVVPAAANARSSITCVFPSYKNL